MPNFVTLIATFKLPTVCSSSFNVEFIESNFACHKTVLILSEDIHTTRRRDGYPVGSDAATLYGKILIIHGHLCLQQVFLYTTSIQYYAIFINILLNRVEVA